LAKSHGNGRVMITDNLLFSKWERIVTDPMTTAAADDLVANCGIMPEFTLRQYRREPENKTENNKEKPMRKIRDLKHYHESDEEGDNQRRTKEDIEECATFVRLELYNRALPCGPKSVQERLTVFYHDKQTPSERTISRILARHGLTHGRTGFYEE